MHPDKKVGLALGILLIGITGAFFFRNEAPSDESPAGQLTSAESLDRRIDRSGSAPYAATDQSIDDQPTLNDIPEVAVSDIVPEIPEAGLFGQEDLLPEPLRPESGADVLAPLPKPDQRPEGAEVPTVQLEQDGSRSQPSAASQRSDSDAVTATPDGVAAVTSDGRSAPEQQIHEVVPGDNLSTLAQRYLGSQSRYLNLYEANRDVLKSPDDLRVGMKLKIPATKQLRSATATDAASSKPSLQRAEDSQAVPRISSRPTAPTFVRPAKSPALPRSHQANGAGKSIGQIPPPDLPAVEGLLPDVDPAVIASRPENED